MKERELTRGRESGREEEREGRKKGEKEEKRKEAEGKDSSHPVTLGKRQHSFQFFIIGTGKISQ